MLGCGLDQHLNAWLSLFSDGGEYPDIGNRKLNYIGIDNDSSLSYKRRREREIQAALDQSPENVKIQHLCNSGQERTLSLHEMPEIPQKIDAAFAFYPLANNSYFPIVIEAIEKLEIGGLLTLNFLVERSEPPLYRTKFLNSFLNDKSLKMVFDGNREEIGIEEGKPAIMIIAKIRELNPKLTRKLTEFNSYVF